jgi:hypothetical protein
VQLSEAREQGLAGGRRRAGELSGAVKKPVDDLRNALHNLASLLLMQQRKTAVPEGFQWFGAAAVERAIFNNSQPISVGA